MAQYTLSLLLGMTNHFKEKQTKPLHSCLQGEQGVWAGSLPQMFRWQAAQDPMAFPTGRSALATGTALHPA